MEMAAKTRIMSVTTIGTYLLLGSLTLGGLGCQQEPAPIVQQPAPDEAAPADPPPPPEQPRPVLTKRWTQEVVDMHKAMMENPKLVEVENKVTGSDPLTTSLEAYIAISSRANVLNFQHQLNILKAVEDRNLTYEEVMDLIKQTKMEFNALPDYQTYAYDDKQGRFTILEDPDAKAEQQNN